VSRRADVDVRQASALAASAVSQYLLAGLELLDLLPEKPRRSGQQTTRAEEIHNVSRSLRMEFVDVHAQWLYASVARKATLAEIAFAAADLVPGLVPTKNRMERERGRRQEEKEGWEIDQGILFRGLLRSPAVGRQLIENMRRPTPAACDLLAPLQRHGVLSLGPVALERKGSVAHVTLQNGVALNAEDNEFANAMEIVVDLVLLDDSVQAAVLRGGVMTHPRYSGRRIFCAGINLKHLHSGQISFVEFLLGRELGFLNKIACGLFVERPFPPLPVEKPWLAVVDGFAIGGGAQILLVCDRVLAAADSYFSLPAAREGIIPGVANLRLARIAGGRLARQVILSGRKIMAREPEAALVFDEIVAPEAIDDAIPANVAMISGPAAIANRRMLRLGDDPAEAFRVYMAEFALEQALRLYAPDVTSKVWEPRRETAALTS
jgi:thioesterase DpgC